MSHAHLVAASGEQLTVSEQLQWIKDGVPRALYSMLEKRLASIFSGAVRELKEFIESAPNNSRHALAACVCAACGQLLDKPMKATTTKENVVVVACESCVLAPGSVCTKWAPMSAWSADAKRRAQVFALKTHCPLGDCEWLGKRSALQPHVEEDCDFTPMPCLYAGCDARLVRCVYLLHLKGCKHRPRGAKLPDDAPHVTSSSSSSSPPALATLQQSASSPALSITAAASSSSSSSSSKKERDHHHKDKDKDKDKSDRQRRREKREGRRKEKREAAAAAAAPPPPPPSTSPPPTSSSGSKPKSPRHRRAVSEQTISLPSPSSAGAAAAAAVAAAAAAAAAAPPVIVAPPVAPQPPPPLIAIESSLSASDLAAAASAAGIDLSKPSEEHVMTSAEARLAAMSQPRVREDNHHKALRRAAFDGDTDELTKLLAEPQTDVNSRDKSGMSLMVSACVNGRLAACRALMRAGADPSLVSATGNGPLHYLCKWKPGSAAAAPAPARPQAAGAAADAEEPIAAEAAAGLGKVARPAGVVSSARQYQRLLSKLIESGAPVTANDQGETPLHVACRSANIAAAVTLLTTTDIDVNQQSTAFSYTPLHLAARSGDLELVKLLLKHGADPLMRAQNFAKRSMIHGFRTTGASDKHRNLPLTPLEIAKRSAAADEVVQMLKHAESERRAALPPSADGRAADDADAAGHDGPSTPRGMVRPAGGTLMVSAPATLQSAAAAAAAPPPPRPQPPAAAAVSAPPTLGAVESALSELPPKMTEGLVAEKKRASGQWGSLRNGAVAQMATLSKEEIAELVAAIQKADGVEPTEAAAEQALVKANSDDESSSDSSDDAPPPAPDSAAPTDDDAAPPPAPATPVAPVAPAAASTPATALPVMDTNAMRQHTNKMSQLQKPGGKVQILARQSNRWQASAPPPPPPADDDDNSDDDANGGSQLTVSDTDAMRRRSTRGRKAKLSKSTDASVVVSGVLEDKS